MLQIIAVRIGTKQGVRAVLLASYSSYCFAFPRQGLLVDMRFQQRRKVVTHFFRKK